MNGSKTISNCRKVGGDYFRLINTRTSNLYLKDFVDKFNFDDYWCFKTTNVQKLVNYQDFLDFEYASYTFFRKDLYHVDRILKWIEWSRIVFNGSGLYYLAGPTPPFPPQKIIIRK